ncbi:hypothetical protein [Fredinandcohnia sp. 179-A 10B2 NHS]|uniref:hypothetical protein n=1 Tax=Fredinandcohnia sp. 179-A 10B2 NHS TaxID=3235176 RepID=UPI0039A2C3F0
MNQVKRGQAISFRIPSDTPDHLVKQLQKLKETERRNFSSKIADFVLQGVSSSFSRERETITIPLPHKLSKTQRNWLKHEHSEALLGSIIYQLLNDPVRATALLASLNSNSLDINEALYLQEKEEKDVFLEQPTTKSSQKETAVTQEIDDLEMFEWNRNNQEDPKNIKENDESENDLDSLLGDFLSKMNK